MKPSDKHTVLTEFSLFWSVRCRVLIGFILGSFSFSCGSGSTNKSPDSVNDPASVDADSTGSKVLSADRVFTKDTFFLDSFLVLVDSFFTAYAGAELDIHYTMDSLTSRDTSAKSRKYIIKPVNGSFARWYMVDAGESNSTMVFQLAECCYPDSASADKGWSEFHRLAGPDFRADGVEDDCFPCLSYGNDLAFRTGNKIFWLCTYCNWDYDKHNTIAALLNRTIYRCEPIDEIRCKCGDVWPRTN